MSADIFVVKSTHGSVVGSPVAAKAKSRKKAPKFRPSLADFAPHGGLLPGMERLTQEPRDREEIDALANGVAHEFNNLLTVILGHTEFLLKRDESKEVHRLRVAEIRSAAERGAWLTKELLASNRRRAFPSSGVPRESPYKVDRRKD